VTVVGSLSVQMDKDIPNFSWRISKSLLLALGETDEEVLHKAAVHSKSVHYIEVTKEVENTARKLKHEE